MKSFVFYTLIIALSFSQAAYAGKDECRRAIWQVRNVAVTLGKYREKLKSESQDGGPSMRLIDIVNTNEDMLSKSYRDADRACTHKN